jgi:hypothetical protein
MKPMRNAVHFLLLSGWGLLGVVFTLHGLGTLGGLLAAGTYWLWLLGFAALTSVVVVRFATAGAAVLVHAGVLLALALVPRLFPASLLRFGLDVLRAA